MTYKSDLVAAPSPRGTNRAGMFVPRAWFPRGVAYDARRGLGYDAPMQPSKAAQVARMLTDILSQDELAELGHAVCSARDAKYGAGADEEAAPSLDPNATRQGVNGTAVRKEQLTQDARRRRVAQDARFGAVLKDAFARPGSAAFDARERRKIAADAPVNKRLSDRFPGFERIGVCPMESDPRDRPAIATDSARLKSLAERYPGFGAIGFA
jgi:hypothetical protein